MEISHSRAAVARGCWKKFYWKYVEELEPIKQSHALTIGKTVHEAFDLYYKGATDDACLKFIEDSFDKAHSEAEAIEKEDMTIAKYTAMGMWKFYPHKKLDDFEAIDPELEFSVKLGRSRTKLIGRMDGHVIQNGVRWVREMKTTGLSEKQFLGRMKTSGQATSYVYASEKMGKPVAGVMFDVIRKPYLRKRANETADEFGRRIFEDFRWRGAEYYTRHFEYRSPETLAMFEQDMTQFMRDLRKHLKTGEFYRNPEQCWNFNSECPYMKICFTEKPDELTMQLLYKKGGRNEQEDGSNGAA